MYIYPVYISFFIELIKIIYEYNKKFKLNFLFRVRIPPMVVVLHELGSSSMIFWSQSISSCAVLEVMGLLEFRI